MSITPEKDPALSPKKTPPAKLAAAVGILVVALAVLFFVVLKPMFFPAEDEFAIPPAAQEGTPAPPGAPVPPGEVPPQVPDGAPPVATPDSAPAPAAAMALSPQEGEIVVFGAISEIRPDGSLMIRTSRVNLYQQGEIQLEPARLKEVKLAPGGAVTQAGTPSGTEAFGIGVNITAVGPNLGEGKVLSAREIAL